MHRAAEFIRRVQLDDSRATALYSERTGAERMNARLKNEFGGNTIMVKGGPKVMGHLMFGVLALPADQLMRLRQ